jgi:murein DD-endopeptidase MepM/ murein hydrolase activator NlpD
MMATTTVKKGDTLTAIAKKAGISLSALLKLNPQIKNPNLINPGQVITVSKATPTSSNAALFGPNDAQNEARLIAEQKAMATPSPVVPVAATPTVPGTGTVTATGTATAVPADSEVFGETVTLEEVPGDGAGNAPAITRTVKSKTPKYDATGKLLGYDIIYTDNTTGFEPGPSETPKKYTWKNPTTGQVETFDTAEEMQAAVETWKVTAGQEATNATTEAAAANARAETLAGRTSAFDLLRDQFDQWGLAELVEPIRALIQDENVSPAEYAIRLRQTKPYLDRFAANADRIKNGYAAINEATYLKLEDQYQNIMRNYGLPESYYARGKNGVQEGFQKLIANDVDNLELEDRIMTAQKRVINSNPEVLAALKSFYPEITNGDILAYTLDPTNGKDVIKRKITAAEIGGAAMQSGLNLGQTPEQRALYAARAAELGAAGIDKGTAQEGFQKVAEYAPRGGQLAAMYGESPYTQQTAEQEVFNLGGSAEAIKQRKKLAGLERASFSGQAGTAQGALGRERAGNF